MHFQIFFADSFAIGDVRLCCLRVNKQNNEQENAINLYLEDFHKSSVLTTVTFEALIHV